jgi:hypothetical protein
MTERKEILHRFREDKLKIMNDNSDIYSSCKCKDSFIGLAGNYIYRDTEDAYTKKSQLYSSFEAKKKED